MCNFWNFGQLPSLSVTAVRRAKISSILTPWGRKRICATSGTLVHGQVGSEAEHQGPQASCFLFFFCFFFFFFFYGGGGGWPSGHVVPPHPPSQCPRCGWGGQCHWLLSGRALRINVPDHLWIVCYLWVNHAPAKGFLTYTSEYEAIPW